MKEVVKSYDNKFVAVKGVSFQIKSGECFGLLGYSPSLPTPSFPFRAAPPLLPFHLPRNSIFSI